MPESVDPEALAINPDLLWQRLSAAIAPKLPPIGFKSLTAATVGSDGAPQARTIILRAVDAAHRTITFHADRTSAKVAELAREPRAAFVGWDAEARLQLRLTARVTVHLDDAAADAFWASTSGLDVYRAVRPSGAALSKPQDAGHVDEPQRERFAMLVAQVTAIEWLWLGKPAQRRGRWTFDGGASHAWLVP